MSNPTDMKGAAAAPTNKAVSLRSMPKAAGKKRKATGPHSKLTTEELERKRAISRRSSQRHRQREKIEVEEYKHKKDALVEANRKVKSDNASLRQVIQVLKANRAQAVQQPVQVQAQRTQQQLIQQALLATSGMANPNPGVTAPSLLARAASTPLPAPQQQRPEVVDLVALLSKAQQQKTQAAPSPAKPAAPAPVQAQPAASTLFRTIMAARRQSQQPQTSVTDSSILATLQALQQQQQQQPVQPQAVPSFAAPAPPAAPTPAPGLDLWATLQANAGTAPAPSPNQQLLAQLQGMTAPAPAAPPAALFNAQMLSSLLKTSVAPPAPVPSAPVPSPALQAAASAPTSALLQELVHRASGNPAAQREMLQLLLAQQRG